MAKKSKSKVDTINTKIQLVMKSGKYVLGTQQSLTSLRQGRSKLVVISNNCPPIRRSEIVYYCTLSKTPIHHYAGNNLDLGTACGRQFRTCVLSVTDVGDSDIAACLIITLDFIGDETLKGQLFSTFCIYGVVERFSFANIEDYSSSSSIIVQYQKLSSAERLVEDIRSQGQNWNFSFDEAESHVGEVIMMSSITPFSSAFVQKVSSKGQYKEKYLSGFETGGDPVWEFLEKSCSTLTTCCIGDYLAELSFPSSADANNFLVTHQRTSAAGDGVFMQHVGQKDDDIASSLSSILERHHVENLGDGSNIEGFVVDLQFNGVCQVDAGVVSGEVGASSPKLSVRPSKGIVFEVQTNFLKVNVGDKVLIRLTNVKERKASLEKVVESLSNSVIKSKSALLKAGAHQRIQMRRQFHQQRIQNHQQRMQRMRLLKQLRHHPPSAPTAVAAANALAQEQKEAQPTQGLKDRLKKMMLENKLKAHPEEETNKHVKRLCAFPYKLHCYDSILVQIDGKNDHGYQAHYLGKTSPQSDPLTTETSSRPENTEFSIFIPSHLIPTHGDSQWHSFAVVGEKMKVILLYCLSVGESVATAQGVASKLDIDFRRATSLNSSSATPRTFDKLQVGDEVVGFLGHVVSAKDVGLSENSPHFPAFLLYRANVSAASGEGDEVPILVSKSSIRTLLKGQESTTELVTLRCSIILHDSKSGHHIICVDEDSYTVDLKEKIDLEKNINEAQTKAIREKLAATARRMLEERQKEEERSKKPKIE